MESVTEVRGRMLPLASDDVDTDQIMPKQFLTRVERSGYGAFVFNDWRRDPAFVFNDRRFAGARVLVAGRNFGSGSSREHAVWGLQQYGFDAVIAPSFSDIFVGNCVQSGLVPVTAAASTCRELQRLAEAAPDTEIVVNLPQRRVSWPGGAAEFQLDDRSLEVLVLGLDDVVLILTKLDAIVAYESRRPSWMPDVAP